MPLLTLFEKRKLGVRVLQFKSVVVKDLILLVKRINIRLLFFFLVSENVFDNLKKPVHVNLVTVNVLRGGLLPEHRL